MVANILPFLMIGGFSKSEVVAYLKAKLEAGKTVLDEIKRREVDEDSMVERKTQQAEAEKVMTRTAAVEMPKELGNEDGAPTSGTPDINSDENKSSPNQ